MSRLITLVALASLAVFALPGLAGATHSNGDGQGAKQDFVDGTGQVGPPTGQDDQSASSELHVNAKVDPPPPGFLQANEPKGQFYFRQADPAIDISGEVTCLAVDDNRAVVGGRVDKSKSGGPIGEGSGVLFTIVDNGEPGDDDVFTPLPVIAAPPARGLCQFLIGEGPIFPTQTQFTPDGGELDRGNFVVHEAAENSSP